MLACVITACLTLPGCGLGTQTVPQPIDPASFTSAEPPAPPRSTSVGQIYLIRERRLVAVPRTTTTLTDTLSLLAAGPTPLDTETGLESPLRGAATVQAVDDAGVATIEVGPEFAELPDHDRYLAAAQLVWTATGVCCTTRVQVRHDTTPVPLPTDGGVVEGPVGRVDYASVAPL
jgi:Sporulation and spore germination